MAVAIGDVVFVKGKGIGLVVNFVPATEAYCEFYIVNSPDGGYNTRLKNIDYRYFNTARTYRLLYG